MISLPTRRSACTHRHHIFPTPSTISYQGCQKHPLVLQHHTCNVYVYEGNTKCNMTMKYVIIPKSAKKVKDLEPDGSKVSRSYCSTLNCKKPYCSKETYCSRMTTDRQMTNRQTDRQTNRQIARQTNRQTNSRQTDIQTDRQ